MQQTNYSSFKQGEIFLTDVRFAESDQSKERPAVILSSNDYNQKSSDLVLFKITSKKRHWLFDVDLAEKNLIEGVLKKESVIKADFPIVIHKTKLSKKIATIDKTTIQEVIRKFNEAIKEQ